MSGQRQPKSEYALVAAAPVDIAAGMDARTLARVNQTAKEMGITITTAVRRGHRQLLSGIAKMPSLALPTALEPPSNGRVPC